jgi:CDP-4-dehydro-6-deoxyglucose reductase, E1
MRNKWPLMENNITRADLDALKAFLETEPILTQSEQVRAFETAWSEWLGVRRSVFVNSGASANLVTLAALKAIYGAGDVIVSPFGWISDIVAVLINGFTPVFVDIHPRTLAMDNDKIIAALTPQTRAVLLTHAQGFCGVTPRLLEALRQTAVPLLEDVCESHGATLGNATLGTLGLAANFSFYYAHHMSTIEGGMVSTNDETLYQTVRMMRSHGMIREATDPALRRRYETDYPDLNPAFIFAYPGFNLRGTEIGAVLGRSQLERLDANNARRRANFACFLEHLDGEKFRTDFHTDGSSNYALNLILRNPDSILRDRVMNALDSHHVEYRRGSAGGGNQLRQPYLSHLSERLDFSLFKEVEHIHFFGFYIGNYPTLERRDIRDLCTILNRV